jgi:hypothetical protein
VFGGQLTEVLKQPATLVDVVNDYLQRAFAPLLA